MTAVFDVGETLVDETAAWTAVAAAASVPCLALFGVIGGLAAVDLHARRAGVERAAIRLDSLAGLPEAQTRV